jgi:AcrR family transcriptional regulator
MSDIRDGRVARAERQREARRREVLAAASRLFAERGYHETSINDIIVEADIARGTFYLYFESKRAIFGELLDGFFATVAAAVRRIEVGEGAPAPLEQMQANVSRIFEVLAAERAMAKILIRGAVGIDEDFDRKISEFYGRVAALIRSGLHAGIEMGLVRPCDADLTAWCVLGSVKELCDRLFVAGDGPGDPGHAARELVEFNLRGVFR